MRKEDEYNFQGEYPVKLNDFLETLDKLSNEINLLVGGISRDLCINKAKYDGYLLSLNNSLDAIQELLRQNSIMWDAVDRNGHQYITGKQSLEFGNRLYALRDKVLKARDNLRERACNYNQDAMTPPSKSGAGDDDWPDPSQHAGVIHGSTDPYPRRGPGGRPYNWPNGKAYPGNDGSNDGPNPGPNDRPDNWPGGGAYPGPDGGGYPSPGGAPYPVPGGGGYPGPGGN
jgi:hypothetical protein